MVTTLPSGALMRCRGGEGPDALLLLSGGFPVPPAPRWGATTAYLARAVARDHPDRTVAELRYRSASWQTFDMCTRDARDALDHLVGEGAQRVLLCGFSMGGAVAVSVCGRPEVVGVVGFAPWLPDGLDLTLLGHRPLRVYHGSLDTDRGLPGVPPEHSRRAVRRARAHGLDAVHHEIRFGVHGVAVGIGDRLLPLPRARAWVRALNHEIAAIG